jgi:hypothetical protein
MGERSPGLREAGGEGGEGFYIARSGRRTDLLVIWEGDVSYDTFAFSAKSACDTAKAWSSLDSSRVQYACHRCSLFSLSSNAC